VVGQLDVEGAAMIAAVRCAARIVGVAALGAAGMGHVGSPDTFFAGEAGPYRVRVVVRLPGVIPGRADLSVRIAGASGDGYRVSYRAAQWNVGLEGAPPAEAALPVRGDPELFAGELWFMTATSYRLVVTIDGPHGTGTATVPVVALATRSGVMTRGLGALLVALGAFLSVGMLTLIGTAVRETVLPPGVEPDRSRRRRGRIAAALAAIVLALVLWGGRAWWGAEAAAYSAAVLYKPFDAEASVTPSAAGPHVLTLAIRDDRWTGQPNPLSRYNALLPDHGKLMHLFLIRHAGFGAEPRPVGDVFAHLHPVPRSAAALEFDTPLPPLPAGRYRVYADIVHESGYAQTLIAAVDLPEPAPQAQQRQQAPDGSPRVAQGDPDDSWHARAAAGAPSAAGDAEEDVIVAWRRGDEPLVEGIERVLAFSATDRAGRPVAVEPYMGMIGHVAVARDDGAVFAHLHPAGSVSMAAMRRFADARPDAGGHAGHEPAVAGELAVPYAFPAPGRYAIWVQMKHAGRVITSAFEAQVEPRSGS
jgi:hypothetical protein